MTWPVAVLRVIVLAVKVLAVIFFFMLARWSWARFRYDQLMALAWLVMLPLGLVNLVARGRVDRSMGRGWPMAGGTADARRGGLRRALSLAVATGHAGPASASAAPRTDPLRQPAPPRTIHLRASIWRRPATMKADDPKIQWVEPPRWACWARATCMLFLKGLTTALRHLFFHKKISCNRPRRGTTWSIRSVYRGVHRLNLDEQGRVKCVACFLCATACPAHCIDIVAAESPWPDREKYPQVFNIDELRCIYCGMCEAGLPGRSHRADEPLRSDRREPRGNDLRQGEAHQRLPGDERSRADSFAARGLAPATGSSAAASGGATPAGKASAGKEGRS